MTLLSRKPARFSSRKAAPRLAGLYANGDKSFPAKRSILYSCGSSFFIEAAVSAQPSFILNAHQNALLESLASELDQSGLVWTSGYLAGLAAARGEAPALTSPPATVAAEKQRLTVLYGSQTGNAKRLAEQLVERAASAGLDVRLLRADAYPLRELKKERLLYVVISTHSTGDDVEPPDDSRDFVEHLEGRRAPKLPDLSYAVLALGDTSYPDFCGIGRNIDERFAELGATRLFTRGDADVDIETVAEPWLDEAIKQARTQNESNEAPARAQTAPGVVTPLHPTKTAWTRQHPFQAEVLVNQRIVANDSGKEVRHMELLLEGSGITYQPGDALGVWPVHSSALVEAVLTTLQLDGDQEVAFKEETRPLSEWLGRHRELTGLTRPFLAAHAELADDAGLKRLLQPEVREELGQLLNEVQLLDFLRQHPDEWSADALVAALRPLAPRMYSIASSQQEVDEEVHLTVDYLHYKSGDEDRWGVATHHLCALEEGDKVPVFIDANDRFRLPADHSRDVIMIGPGTGVAPFRAFVQERAAAAASGRNWLFFGNPHRRSDFLYQLEWQQAVKRGHLHRLDVAFSRDQGNKIYVQHRLREQGAELWSWLQGGAHVYVCGDADRMAPDVHAALTEVAVEHGAKSQSDAEAWLNGLMTEGRYARDVY
jgi:sulfite reductase (NADPH) flavoprotein alpha-component